MDTTSMILAEDLTKQFESTLAVDGLNLTVSQGEVFGFLGPNGAGKTTTVRMLTSLIAPTAGGRWSTASHLGRQDDQIRRTRGRADRDPRAVRQPERRVQPAHLRQPVRGERCRRAGGEIPAHAGPVGAALRADRHLLQGHEAKAGDRPGAAARAARSCSWTSPPPRLDPEAARLVRDFIAELRSEGRTIFLCTHNLDEADRLCDRIGGFQDPPAGGGYARSACAARCSAARWSFTCAALRARAGRSGAQRCHIVEDAQADGQQAWW